MTTIAKNEPSQLTPRTRFVRHALFQPVDRPPYFETLGFWPQTLERWYAEGLPHHIRHRNDPEGLQEGQITIEQYFEMESYSWAPFLPNPTTTPFWPPFEREVIEEDDETIVFRDPSGVVRKDVKSGRSLPQFLEYPVKTAADWERLKPRLGPAVSERYDQARAAAVEFSKREDLAPLPICGAYGLPRNLLGTENLSYAYYDTPELLRDIMRQWLAFYVEYARRLTAIIDFDYVFLWEDLAYKNGPLVSPALADEFMFPYYRELIQELRQLGYQVFALDSDGNPKALMDGFVEVGVNHFEPCEIASDMEPQWIRKRYGERCAIQGGIDKRALAKGKAAIEQEVMRKVPALLKGGGYTPGVDHAVPSDVALEDFRFFLDLVRTLGEHANTNDVKSG
jgi:uroporphyrinogen decarboxylase